MEENSIIAQYLKSIQIDENTPSQVIDLSILKKISNINSEIFLDLGPVKSIEKPDGVYELWLGNSKTNLEFVQVLDLYTLQTQKNAIISIPIGDFLKSKFFDKFIFLEIVFSGNSDSNQNISKKAGVLKIDKIKIYLKE